MRTMMGFSPEVGGPAAAPVPAAAPMQAASPAIPNVTAPVAKPVAAAFKTMIGMQVSIDQARDLAAAPAGIGPGSPVAQKPAAVLNTHQTMLGAALPGAPGALPPAGAPGGPIPVANVQRTMMGAMAGMQGPSAPMQGGPANVANAQRTMMGVNMNAARSEGPPMMGGASPGVPPDTVPPGRYQAAPNAPSPGYPGQSAFSPQAHEDSFPSPKRKSARSPLLIAGIAVGGLLVVGGIATLALGGRATPEIPLQAQVQPGQNDTLLMTVTIPGMPPGTTARYGAQQQPLDAQSQARFSLSGMGNRVGAIDLPIDVTAPNAAAQRRTARIVIAYRVDPDLTGLANDPPGLRLVFHTVPGSRLLVNNQPVSTDRATGIGAATIDNVPPMPVDGPDTRADVFRVQVTAPDGTVASGSYELRVPRVPLAIDRPTRTIITSSEHVLVRGRAPGAQRVTLNGVPVPLAQEVFQTVSDIPAPGRASWNVIAYSPTGAPALAHIEIERVAGNDRPAITRYLGPASVSAGELASGVALTPGTRIRVRGRVLGAVIQHDSAPTFQLGVTDRPCTAARCIVWVDPEPGVAPAENSTVEVVGTVSGRRSWSPAGGERRSDHVINAAFVQ